MDCVSWKRGPMERAERQNQRLLNNPWQRLQKAAFESTLLMPTNSQGLEFHQGALGSQQVVTNGELAVSLLQKATQETKKIQDCLVALEDNLSNTLANDVNQSDFELLEHFIQMKLSYIHHLASNATFKDQNLLSGQLGIQGSGVYTKALGAPRDFRGPIQVHVEVQKPATCSYLIGHQPLTENLIRQEKQIILSENGNLLKYNISSKETVESLINGLQNQATEAGLDLEISKTDENYLLICHRQYGSVFVFSGRSMTTSLLSHQPGAVHFCTLGQNCEALVNGKPVETRGNLLLCDQIHGALRGISILWKKGTLGTDTLVVQQSPLSVPGGHFLKSGIESIALPSCLPENLGIGICNRSGFQSLKEITANSWQEIQDALYLIRISKLELQELLTALATMETEFQEMAMAALTVTDFEDNQYHPWQMPLGDVTEMSKALEQIFNVGTIR